MAINTITGVQWGAGFFMAPAEFAPQHSGVVFGISNVFATWSGTVSLIVTKELTANVSIAAHLSGDKTRRVQCWVFILTKTPTLSPIRSSCEEIL